MSYKGTQESVQQVGSTYLVKSDGLVEATITFAQTKGSDVPANTFTGDGSAGNISGAGQSSAITTGSDTGSISGQVVTSTNNGLPAIGGEHPNHSGLYCTRRTTVYEEGNVTKTTCDFLGIEGDETERYLAYNAGVNSESIEAHPRFDEIGGTPAEPKNGAIFDENSQFKGFESSSDFAGESNYYAPGANVEVTYYTFSKPTLENRMKVFYSPKMGDQYFLKPSPETINYLLTDTPYREVVPGTGLYQVTEQYLQSEEYGWNSIVYKKGEE